MATNDIEIETLNYFGDSDDRNFNAKVLYRKKGKMYLAHIDIDYFNKRVFIPRQPREAKIVAGFEQAIHDHVFKTK